MRTQSRSSWDPARRGYRASARASAASACLVALACANPPPRVAVAPEALPSVAAPPSAPVVDAGPAPVDCARWESHQSFPVAAALRAAWVARDGQAVFVGDEGSIVHFDGQRWFTRPAPDAESLSGVWGSAADDVYTVGSGNTILHFDGRRWSPVATSIPASAHLGAIWGSAADDVFAVGRPGVIVHYDGVAWTTMPGGATSTLRDVWGTSSANVFAVSGEGVILHYDGKGWSRMRAGATNYLSAVFGTGPDDVYAAGEESLHHFDGKQWKTLRRRPVDDLFIAAHSPRRGEVLVTLTTAYLGENEVPRNDLLRLTGKTWTAHELPEGPFAAFASAPDGSTYVAGAHGAIHRLRGAESERITPPLAESLIRVIRSSDGGMVGLRRNGALMARRDGVWSDLPPAPVAAAYDLAVEDGGALWVAGADRAAGRRRPVIAYFDGQRWTTAWTGKVGDGAALLAFGGAASDRFAVGTQGLIMHHDGDRWAAMDSPMKGSLTAVWAAASDDVFAVGARNGREGSIIHYDGTAWSLVSGVKAPPLAGVWGSSAADVFAVGGAVNPDSEDGWDSSTAILHYDGERWSTLRADADAQGELFVAVWGNSARDVFALSAAELGDGGHDYSSWTLLHYDGATWTPLSKGPGAFLAGTSTPQRTHLVGRARPAELACAEPAAR